MVNDGGNPSLSLVPPRPQTHKTGSTTLATILRRLATATGVVMYDDGQDEVLIGESENQGRLGRCDMVTNHLRVAWSSRLPYNCQAAALDFYTRALGTPDYSYVTVLRQPVDRYISHFYYFTEPDARMNGVNITLKEHVESGQGGNAMAAEFSIASLTDAMDFVASEQLSDGFFIPIELLDYGLALLSTHCGWSTAHMLYLPANRNTGSSKRYDGLQMLPRVPLSELAATDPSLLSAIQQLNTLDALLYSAALAAFMARLSPGSAAAGSGVLQRAVKLTAARTMLKAQCRRSWDAAARRRAKQGGRSEGHDEQLAALCDWYVGKSTNITDPGVIQMAEQYGRTFDDPTLSFYHMLAGVRLGGTKTGPAGGAPATNPAELQAAVSRWVEHHARAGFDHLVLCVDGLDGRRVKAVRRAAHAVLAGGGGGKAGGAAHAHQGYVGTTYGVVRCGDTDLDAAAAAGPPKGPAAAMTSPLLDRTGGGGAITGASVFTRLTFHARWSALLPDVQHYVSATRGTARSVVLSLEAAHPDMGVLCLPVVPWGEVCRPSSSPGRNCTALPRAVRAADCVRLAAMPILGYGKLYTSGGEELLGMDAYGGGDSGNRDRPQRARRALLKDRSHRVDEKDGGRDAAGGREDPGAGGNSPASGEQAVLRQQHRLQVLQLPTRAEAEGAGVSVEACAARTLMLAH